MLTTDSPNFIFPPNLSQVSFLYHQLVSCTLDYKAITRISWMPVTPQAAMCWQDSCENHVQQASDWGLGKRRYWLQSRSVRVLSCWWCRDTGHQPSHKKPQIGPRLTFSLWAHAEAHVLMLRFLILVSEKMLSIVLHNECWLGPKPATGRGSLCTG